EQMLPEEFLRIQTEINASSLDFTEPKKLEETSKKAVEKPLSQASMERKQKGDAVKARTARGGFVFKNQLKLGLFHYENSDEESDIEPESPFTQITEVYLRKIIDRELHRLVSDVRDKLKKEKEDLLNSYHEALPQDDVISSNSWLKSSKKSENMKTYLRKDREAARVQCMTKMKESSFLPKSPQLVSFTGWRDPTVSTPRTSSFRGSQASVDAKPEASRKERTVRETSIDSITEEERRMKESSFLPKSPQLVSFTGWRDPTVSTPRTSSFRGSQASVDAKPEASRKERTVRETSIDSITEEERRVNILVTFTLYCYKFARK
ncbi:uncharacterized protein TNCT_632891, partial [Trichonephila clavata]